MSTFRLEVVTPERTVLDQDVESVLLPAKGGQLGIWANHAPMIAALEIGVAQYGPKSGRKENLAVGGGFIEMDGTTLRVFANTAETAEEIDVMRAQEAKDRAEQRLQDMQSEWDHYRAEIALQKALTRLRAAGE